MPRTYSREPPEQRFWRKVRIGAPDECWVWTAAINRFGYGHFGVSAQVGMVRAHRFAYEISNGPVPPGLVVMHTCDRRECVNPGHLVAASQSANIRDMVTKGRGVYSPLRGEENGAAKLTEGRVLEIREALANGLTVSRVAREHEVCRTTVYRIRDGRNWRHVA